MLRPRALAALAVWTGLCAVPLAAPVRAETPTIYKWVDENGIAHYTTDRDRIPRNLRDRVKRLDRGESSRVPQPGASTAGTGAAAGAAAAGAAGSSSGVPVTGPSGAGAAGARTRPAGTRQPADDSWATRDASSVTAEEVATDPVTGEALAAGAGGATVAASAPVPLSPEEQTRRSNEIQDLDERIASLENEIAADEEILKSMISDVPAEAGIDALADDPEFQAVVRRFPRLQSNLAALKRQRQALDAPAASEIP